jgi:probable HAF family extracellular repeat protein
MFSFKSAAFAAVVACALPSASAQAATPFYQIIDLGDLGGSFPYSYARAISKSGVIAVDAQANNIQRPYLWDNGAVTELPTLGGNVTIARGLNSSGLVVGTSSTPEGSVRGVTWENGVISQLPGDYIAEGVNEAGQIIGYTRGTKQRAQIYQNGSFTNLGTLGGDYSFGTAINESGWTSGDSGTVTGERHAFLHDGTQMIDLGTLGGNESSTYGMNDFGDVVGVSRNAGNDLRGFFYDGTQMIGIGTLGGKTSLARGINNQRYVVGNSSIGSADHAFIYRDGYIRDLNDFIAPNSGWVLRQAADITSNGWVIGGGFKDGGTILHAFLLKPLNEAARSPFPNLIPVPEPASWAMMILGFGLAGAAARRRTLSIA